MKITAALSITALFATFVNKALLYFGVIGDFPWFLIGLCIGMLVPTYIYWETSLFDKKKGNRV